MRQQLFLMFLFFFSINLYAQTGLIMGKVVDSSSGRAIPFANVFLNQATKSTQTNDLGEFNISAIKPGQYDVIVSYMGYKKFSEHINVDNDKHNLFIKLEKNVIQLQDVIIKPDLDWARNYAVFKRIFIGQTENASFCKILNPKVVQVSYHKQTSTLEASTNEFLIIENANLGYRLKYLVSSFSWERKTGLVFYSGEVLFEELSGNKSQMKKWTENRQRSYTGSSMHFFRALIQNRLIEEGFIARKLIKKTISRRPSDSVIAAKITRFQNTPKVSEGTDSLNHWLKLQKSPKAIQFITKDTLKANNLLKVTNVTQQYALHFNDYLYVVLTRKVNGQTYPYIHNLLENSDHPSSIVTLKEPYALLDANGIVINPESIVYEGYWNQGVAELLPVDFSPE